MTSNRHEPPSDPKALAQAIETLRLFYGVVLLSYSRNADTRRDVTIRNFIARGMACLESIFLVWDAGSEQDAWILHRTLLDRLFHLHALAEANDFAAFEDFSLRSSYPKASPNTRCATSSDTECSIAAGVR